MNTTVLQRAFNDAFERIQMKKSAYQDKEAIFFAKKIA
jgi:hypothetical protein